MKMMLIDTKLAVNSTNQFNRSLKKAWRQGKDINKLKEVVYKLANKEILDSKYRNHRLVSCRDYNNCYECHIEPDWLLIYQYVNNELVLLLIDIGSHSDLFR